MSSPPVVQKARELGTLAMGLIAVVVIVGGLYATWRIYDTYQSRPQHPSAQIDGTPAPPQPSRSTKPS